MKRKVCKKSCRLLQQETCFQTLIHFTIFPLDIGWYEQHLAHLNMDIARHKVPQIGIFTSQLTHLELLGNQHLSMSPRHFTLLKLFVLSLSVLLLLCYNIFCCSKDWLSINNASSYNNDFTFRDIQRCLQKSQKTLMIMTQYVKCRHRLCFSICYILIHH